MLLHQISILHLTAETDTSYPSEYPKINIETSNEQLFISKSIYNYRQCITVVSRNQKQHEFQQNLSQTEIHSVRSEAPKLQHSSTEHRYTCTQQNKYNSTTAEHEIFIISSQKCSESCIQGGEDGFCTHPLRRALYYPPKPLKLDLYTLTQ